MTNIINLTDSYKFSHFNQYPKGTEIIHSYLAPRGGEYDKVVFFGLQYYLKQYLEVPVTKIDIEESEKLAKVHGVPFNKEGWEYIVEKHRGFLPVEIKALPEGEIYGNKEPLLTIENTDPNCAWLVGYLETLLLKIWYPTTIASKSYAVKQMLLKHWERTSDNIAGVDFAYHNFGDRGSSSVESAAIGGVAHLTQFKGTDNFNALALSNEYYDGKYQGFSVPASEHSTVTSWGRENEFEMIENYLETYKSSPIIACVLDSYDIYKAVDFVTSGKMKEKIESDEYPIYVCRPDSGSPIEVIEKIVSIMMSNKVKFKINSKGFIVFCKYRIIWGDGITQAQIDNILSYFTGLSRTEFPYYKLSAENFAFGSGGDLMQNVSRDTLKFAMKASAIKVNGEWRDVYKDPITDIGKKSIRGRVIDDRMKIVFKNGSIINL
jgi:nicotinamide phosphoribosyltransferase